jgi:K+-sensing histidine kinase KdpD
MENVSESFRTVEVSYQLLTFEHVSDCHMLTVRDISHIERLEKQKELLQVMDLVTSSVTHDMLTPLKSVSCLSKRLSQKLIYESQSQKDSALIYSTTQLLLSEVNLLLDRSMLDKNKFRPSLDKHPVNKTIE